MSLKRVQAHVLRLRHQAEIVWVVVVLHVVAMMNMLVGLQATADEPFHDEAMFSHVVADRVRMFWPVKPDIPIAVNAAAALPIHSLFTGGVAGIHGGTHLRACFWRVRRTLHRVIAQACGPLFRSTFGALGMSRLVGATRTDVSSPFVGSACGHLAIIR